MTGPTTTPGRSGRIAAFWLLLLLAGQAATLRLILAGPHVRYQHFVSPDRPLGHLPLLPLPVLGLQALVVLVGLFGMRREIPALLGATGRGWRLAAVVLTFVLASTALSRDVRAYALDLAITTSIQLLHLATVVLFARALPPAALEAVRRAAERVLGPPRADGAAEPGGIDRFALAGAVWVTLVAALLVVVAYQRHPHVPDETVYLLHARYFAAGHLTLPIPAAPDAFNLDLMTYEATRWYSPVPPGWPLALAVGAFIGVPWLVNPVLGGLNVLLTYLVLREFYARRTARLAVLLFCVSPWQIFLAMSFMTHTWTLTCALAATAAVARLRRDPQARWAVLGGAAIGMVSIIRPLEGLIVALLLGVWSLGARGARWRFAPSAVLTFVTAAVGALVLPYNRFLTGSARIFPIEAYADRLYGKGSNALGFGPNRGLGWALDPYPGHGWRDVLVNTNLNISGVNAELLGWATGSLVVIALLVYGARLKKSDWQMLAVIGAVTTAHHFYWYSGGPDFGARYWYLIIVPCLALAARGIEHLEEAAGGTGPGARGSAVTAASGALMLGTVLLFIPWRAIDKYYHYRGMQPGAEQLAHQHDFGRSLVLVRGNRDRDYASAAPYNPLDLTAAVPVFAWDRDAATREAVLRAYADRPVWFLDGPGLTNAGWRIAAGPLTADAARAVPGAWTQ